MKPLSPTPAASLILGALCLAGATVRAADYESAPIHYSNATPKDAAWRLQQAILSGDVTIDRTDAWTVMRDLMRHFEIPEATQVMVFSKTSKQNHLIHPQTPRVIYFGDNAYIGYCIGGSIEVATVDPVLGPVFYLLEPNVPPERPLEFVRDQSCLSCHGGPFYPDVPAVLVRSVFPGRQGHPMMSQGSTVVNTTTPFQNRWGGWYVTGRHGGSSHRGNAVMDDRAAEPELEALAPAELETLAGVIDTRPYPAPTSDVVALMVLEHQTSTQNALTKAAHAALRAMHRQQSLQRELGEPVEEEPVGTALRIIDNAVTQVLDALLFKDEAALPEGGIDGTESFQSAFVANARRSKDGRSLKDFQLLNRLFKHRCSYMIHSITFEHLPAALKMRVLTRLGRVLRAEDDDSDRYDYLGASERAHILRILQETLSKNDVRHLSGA
jgi:hypothetical protein